MRFNYFKNCYRYARLTIEQFFLNKYTIGQFAFIHVDNILSLYFSNKFHGCRWEIPIIFLWMHSFIQRWIFIRFNIIFRVCWLKQNEDTRDFLIAKREEDEKELWNLNFDWANEGYLMASTITCVLTGMVIFDIFCLDVSHLLLYYIVKVHNSIYDMFCICRSLCDVWQANSWHQVI